MCLPAILICNQHQSNSSICLQILSLELGFKKCLPIPLMDSCYIEWYGAHRSIQYFASLRSKLLILHSHVTYALQLLSSLRTSRNGQFSRKGLQSDIFCSSLIWAVSQMNLPTNSNNLYQNSIVGKFLPSIIRINLSYYWRVICDYLNSQANVTPRLFLWTCANYHHPCIDFN